MANQNTSSSPAAALERHAQAAGRPGSSDAEAMQPFSADTHAESPASAPTMLAEGTAVSENTQGNSKPNEAVETTVPETAAPAQEAQAKAADPADNGSADSPSDVSEGLLAA
ncbi:MAG: hypothetical protein Q4F72_07980 [Desulfovibrionaceae bacterium]|nr:hypothetical protein [Desulfovibrionaceae bacterium]